MNEDESCPGVAVKKLSSGHWHVKIGQQVFVQWPTCRAPTTEDVFHGGTEDVGRFVDIAARAAAWAEGCPSAATPSTQE